MTRTRARLFRVYLAGTIRYLMAPRKELGRSSLHFALLGFAGHGVSCERRDPILGSSLFTRWRRRDAMLRPATVGVFDPTNVATIYSKMREMSTPDDN
jgi:hypothetical protein